MNLSLKQLKLGSRKIAKQLSNQQLQKFVGKVFQRNPKAINMGNKHKILTINKYMTRYKMGHCKFSMVTSYFLNCMVNRELVEVKK